MSGNVNKKEALAVVYQVLITQKEFAKHLGWTYARLNEIINGRRNVSADSALALGEALNTGPKFWLNLPRDWDLWHAMHKKTVEKFVRSLSIE